MGKAVFHKVGSGNLQRGPQKASRGPSKMRNGLISLLFYSCDNSTMGACITVIYIPIRGFTLLTVVRRPVQTAVWPIKASKERNCSMGQKIRGGLMCIYQGDLDIKSLKSSALLYEVLRVSSVHIVCSQRRITLWTAVWSITSRYWHTANNNASAEIALWPGYIS